MKRIGLYALVAVVLYAGALTGVMLCHNHWQEGDIDNGSKTIYCRFVQNPLLHNPRVLIIPQLLSAIAFLGMFILSGGMRFYRCAISSPVRHTDPFPAFLFLRSPPARG